MQGYQNVQAVCSAHYEPVARLAGAFGARGKHAFALSISQCVRFYGETARGDSHPSEFQLRPLARKGRQSVKPYFHPARETPLIARRIYARDCKREDIREITVVISYVESDLRIPYHPLRY